MRQQSRDEFLLFNATGFRLEHQTHGGIFARFIAHHVKQGQDAGLELHLVCTQSFLARLHFGVGEFFNFFQHFLRTHANGQFSDHQLPLAARQVFNFPTRAHLQRPTTCAIGICNVRCRADDLTAARIVGARHQGKQFFVGELGRLDECHAGIGHFAQIVTWNFSGQTHRNATGTVHQHKGQTRWQLPRLFGRAIVVGNEVNSALVYLIQQQGGDFGKPCFCVAHGRSAIAIATAKVALSINERVALAEVLRHANQCIVSCLIAMRMEAAQDIAHHARTFNWLGTRGAREAQAHARHGIQNAPLHRFLAIAHIGQSTALDHAQGIFKVGTLCIRGQIQGVIGLAVLKV